MLNQTTIVLGENSHQCQGNVGYELVCVLIHCILINAD